MKNLIFYIAIECCGWVALFLTVRIELSCFVQAEKLLCVFLFVCSVILIIAGILGIRDAIVYRR